MFKLVAMLVGGAVAAASPAVARDHAKPDGGAAAPTAVSSNASSQTADASNPQRYCIVDTPTGSHIVYRTCKTRAQWLAEGFDPTAK
ncbi:hypothetical protein [Sphingomonas sp. TREG-RG-20F-R18-01]|uniref:hypothetical protein n=1 Tax=Sphingomonas sp. TREG-RG-20F-R18-01 TaxID=2914982 RepID=UPI001F5661B5|nr:hypothetical protein [Sphingomonas sp. TREG-RG-20F-R18-01]